MPALCGHDDRRFMPPPSVAKQRQSVSKGGTSALARASTSSFSCSPPRSHPPSAPRLGAGPALCGHGAAGSTAPTVLAAEREKNTGKNISKPLARKSCPVFCQSSAIANGKARLRNCRCRCLCSNASACHDGCRNYLALDSDVEGNGIEAAGLRLAWFGVRTVTQETM